MITSNDSSGYAAGVIKQALKSVGLQVICLELLVRCYDRQSTLFAK